MITRLTHSCVVFLLPDLRSPFSQQKYTVFPVCRKEGAASIKGGERETIALALFFYCIKSPRGKTLPILKLSCGFLLLGSHRCGSVVRRQTIVWDD